MPARKPTAPEADISPREALDAAVEHLVSVSRTVAAANQLDSGNYRLQFSGGELLSLSAR